MILKECIQYEIKKIKNKTNIHVLYTTIYSIHLDVLRI